MSRLWVKKKKQLEGSIGSGEKNKQQQKGTFLLVKRKKKATTTLKSNLMFFFMFFFLFYYFIFLLFIMMIMLRVYIYIYIYKMNGLETGGVSFVYILQYVKKKKIWGAIDHNTHTNTHNNLDLSNLKMKRPQ